MREEYDTLATDYMNLKKDKMRLEEKFAESSETMSVKSNDESSSELKEKCKQQELVIKELEKRRAAAKKEIKVLMARA